MKSWWHPDSLFEVGSGDRLLAMEGLRGVAVGLVFLQHYCVSFIKFSDLGGVTGAIAAAFRSFGNYGVELFFVLSGFLIYGILLRRRPTFFAFIGRRAQRLYPAFLTVMAVAILLDSLRRTPEIPPGLAEAAAYIGANLAFLPGLLPIEPLFAVNWSLSYEWWFYIACTVLVANIGFGRLDRRWRVTGILLIGMVLIVADALGVPHVPIRGLCLLAGMILAESQDAAWPRVGSSMALIAVVSTFWLVITVPLSGWLIASILAVSFTLLCSAAFRGGSTLARLLSWRPLRWFGNMSYSFYLTHGIIVAIFARLAFGEAEIVPPMPLFWLGLVPTFVLCLIVGAMLFLLVEKPFSLQRRSDGRSTPFSVSRSELTEKP